MKFLVSCMVVLGLASGAQAELPWQPDSSSVWPAAGGQVRIELRGDYLADFGVEVADGSRPQPARYSSQWPVGEASGTLWIFAPFGNFEWISGGQIRLETDLSLAFQANRLPLSQMVLVPGEHHRIPVLQLHDAAGNHLANVTHIHADLHHARQLITLHNADIIATNRLAEMLGQPALAGMPLGQMWLDLAIDIPVMADLSRQSVDFSGQGLSCDNRPFWPQDGHQVDVALIDMGIVSSGGFDPAAGYLKITPSATLKNVGVADVPWVQQFESSSLYPHQPRDQHPFLRWNLYRIHDGRIEQLAASGTKHAFWTINVNCDLNCGSGRVLWPGCEDVYGTGSNDTSTYQGPRDEIAASLGLWDNCGSFFDPACTGSQTQGAGEWSHRLLVDTDELDHADATYFLDSWYVVQFDIDIWNTMGYHRINPTQTTSGGYTFGPLGPFTQGPPVGEWVAPGDPDPMADHQLVVVESLTPDALYPDNMPQGHARVLVRVEALPEGGYRYRYAVMNYDLDRGIQAFRVPADGVQISETWMGGPPDELSSPWPASESGGMLSFSAPGGDFLSWFTLYNFEFVADAAPVTRSVELDLAGRSLPSTVTVTTLAPGTPTGSEGFDLEVTPGQLSVCTSEAAEYAIDVVPGDGFGETVSLAVASGLPPGSSFGFSVNPVPPGGTSILGIDVNAADEGEFTIVVDGQADGGDHQASVSMTLSLNEPVAGAPALSSPTDNTTGVAQNPTFEWSEIDHATQYRLQVATPGNFNDPLIDETVDATSHVPSTSLASATVYEWRVRAENQCGEGDYSTIWSFQTGGDEAGDTIFADRFEEG